MRFVWVSPLPISDVQAELSIVEAAVRYGNELSLTLAFVNC